MNTFSTQIEKVSIEFPCPNPNGCSHKLRETIGNLKRSPKLKCSRCGFEFVADGKDFERAGKSVDEKLAELKRSLER